GAIARPRGAAGAIRAGRGGGRGRQRRGGAGGGGVLASPAGAPARLDALSGADQRLDDLRAEVAALRASIGELAARVSSGRSASAAPLGETLTAELQELGMAGASIRVTLRDLQGLAPVGAARVERLVCPGPGQPMLPLAKAVSGGELSRVMLACRSVLSDLDDTPTLVFDEVDAGIGGVAGLAVGRRLARLAADRQVVVVTH